MRGRSLSRLTLLHKTILVGLFLAPLAAAPLYAHDDWKYEETRNDARDFVSGGSVHVRLSVGDIHVKRGDSAKIRLSYTVKSRHESNVKDSHVDFDIHGNDANTNIDVHEKVGDLTVDNVEGDKDLSLGVGDIRITTGHSGYRMVNASTGIGDVNSEGYGETSGWLGKTLKYHGDGKYELRAHVGVGDIHLDGQ
jgi:hypothetical protein